MKKFLISLLAASLCTISANAQNAASTVPTQTVESGMKKMENMSPEQKGKTVQERAQRRQEMKTKREEKYNSATAEQKAKMDANREKFKNASPEEKGQMVQEKTEKKEARHEKHKERCGNAAHEEKARMDEELRSMM